MIVGFTGHRELERPEKQVAKALIKYINKIQPAKAISGMAIGFDQLAARVCIHLGIPLIAAVPAKEQPNFWPLAAIKNYFKILARADSIVFVDTVKAYSDPNDNFIQKLFNRNYWIVDNSDRIVAYYRGTGRGGTASTVRYTIAQKKKLSIMKLT